MKKKIWTVLFVLVLCLCVTVPAFAEGAAGFAGDKEDRVVDGADLLSDIEETELREKLEEIRVRQKMDIVIVTAKTLNGADPTAYADDFYDYNGYGYGNNRDGLLLLISMEKENRVWYISTTGYGITAFTDAGIQYIGNKLKEPLSDEDYAAAFNTFAELCDDVITKARTGTPYDSSNMPKEPMKRGWILVAIIVGFILSFITVGNMKGKLKTVRFQPAANSYMKAGSMNITESRDMFLYNTVTRTAKPKANDSDSEGSSTHTSSSGSTHGGGGGSF